MTHVEMEKCARALKALAKPLFAGGGRLLRTAEEFAADALPAARYPTWLGRNAGRAERMVQKADAYTSGLNPLARGAMRVGQFATGAAPFMGIAALPSYVTPVWSTMQNVGNAAGQVAKWGLQPENTQRQVTQGAQDGMINAYEALQAQPFMQRRDMISGLHQGTSVAPLTPHGWPGVPRQLRPSGRGDMSGWLTQRALLLRQQQQLTKAGRAHALMGVARGLFRGAAPAARAGGAMGAGQLARKWIPRAAKSLAYAAPIPLGVGAVTGWQGADGAARQVGSDIALNEFQQRMQQQGVIGRTAIAADPSLIMGDANRSLPGLYQRYRETRGQPLQLGMLANLREGWNHPSWQASDSAGSYSVPNSSRPQ